MMESALHPQLDGISHGDHCCLLFNSPERQTQTTATFLTIGIERNERSLYVGDADSVDRLRERLKSVGVDVEAESRRGRLIMSSDRDYLDHGKFNTDRMISFLQQTYDSALADGFTALRATGDVSWEVGPEQNFKDIVYYETLLDIFFLGKKMVGMCQYPQEKCPPETLAGILSTHRVANIDGEACSNFHYLPPDILVAKNAAVREQKRIEWMTSQLLRARRAEEEILRLNADLERRVEERTAELQAAFKEMESFSYSVSHDLRAPLRVIDGFSKILLEDAPKKLNEEERAHLDRIRQGTQRMDEIIRDLLQLSKLSREETRMTNVNMTDLAKTAAHEAGAEAAIVDELPAAYGDPSLLRQLFVNLISNAEKFSRNSPGPKIEVRGIRNGDGQTVYQVKDNGAGFDMALVDKLFGAFQRLHSHDEFEGTGIGLATAQRIVQKHGGRIWAESEIGQGATFSFTLMTRNKIRVENDRLKPESPRG